MSETCRHHTDHCPECGSEMERKSVSGRDFKGRGVGVSWHECDDCELIVDEFGNVVTKRDRQHAMAKAEKAHRDAKQSEINNRERKHIP